jgi:hypothetical protein
VRPALLQRSGVQQAGGAVFDPSTITGYRAHWDASALVGYDDDDPVEAIEDISGNGENTAGAGGSAVTYKTGIQNGLPGLLFGASSNQVLSSMPALGTNQTVYIVCRPGAGMGAYGAFFHSPGTATGIFFRSDEDKLDVYDGGDHLSSTAQAEGTTRLYTVAVTAGDLAMFLDGVADGTASSVPLIGTYSSMGNDAGNNHYLGYIFEIIIYNAALSSGDRGDAEDHLLAKWGI